MVACVLSVGAVPELNLSFQFMFLDAESPLVTSLNGARSLDGQGAQSVHAIRVLTPGE